MPPGTDQVVLAPAPRSPGEARRFVERALRAHGAIDNVEVGVLLASELVTNAVLHGGTQVTVEVASGDGGVAGDRIRVSVRDESDRPLQRRQAHPDAISGRGLTLVAELALAWGVDLADDDGHTMPGKVVWFELLRR